METDLTNIVPAFTDEANLKRAVRRHLRSLGFSQKDNRLVPPRLDTKDLIRETYRQQKNASIQKNFEFIKTETPKLANYFADGTCVIPAKINLQLQRVKPGTLEARLFRLASLSWSVPVSNGFGRRLRYLVWDSNNGKLAGLFALGDPVYNSSVREGLIGWSPKDKKANLVNILDAYVLGAVPPYNLLLGGKAVACMIRTTQVVNDFKETYGQSTGIISKENKHADLLAVTTSSSMGRSSVYNRLKLANTPYFQNVGYTKGWGHFHFSDDLFLALRGYLRSKDHDYADQNRFGSGPNWKFRTIRTGLQLLGFDPGILRHGIKREAFVCLLADNAIEQLNATDRKSEDVVRSSLLTAEEVSELAKFRWIVPRAERDQSYLLHKKDDFLRTSLRILTENPLRDSGPLEAKR